MEKDINKVNREYKDSVFVDLFTSWESPISLYNALSSNKIPEYAKIRMLQISNALYTSLRCDVSFTVENELIVIIEHQSTINENMPTRLLLYVSMLYLNVLDEETRYARRLKPIPTPRFFVLYNGDEKLPERSELRLSKAFMLKGEERPQLELTVPVININYGQNKAIMDRCKTLRGYSYLIERIKNYRMIDEEHQFDLAIKDCIDHGVLDDYLIKQRKRIKNMLQTEYNFATELAVRTAEEREAGILLGMQRGRMEGIREGIREGIVETARNLINMGMSYEDIVKATGLSIEVIEKL